MDVISKKEGDKDGKLRLAKVVTDIIGKLNSIKFEKIKPLFEPAVITIPDDDLEDNTEKKENDDGQDNKKMKESRRKLTNWI